MNERVNLLAKSNGETLKVHTNKLLKNLSILRKVYSNDLEESGFHDKDWDLVYYAALYHDFGKAAPDFQQKLKDEKHSKNGKEIPHGFLSPVFLDYDTIHKKYSDDEAKLLVHVIAHHHDRDIPDAKKLLSVLKELDDLADVLNEHFGKPIAKYCPKEYKRYLNVILKKDFEISGDIKRKYILVKGLLNRLDYSASANVPIEIRPARSVRQKTIEWMQRQNFNLRDVQDFAIQNSKKNLVIVASTGMGKTEAALLWSDARKTFFTLPIRTSINAIYKRIKALIGFKDVGLLHSASLEFLYEDSKKQSEIVEDYFNVYKLSKELSYPITVCTIDQIFTFPFRHCGYERILSTLAYSNVVIDEIQSYTPKIVATIIAGLKEITDYGGRFLIMSATIPNIYINELERIGIGFEVSEFYDFEPRNMMAVIEDEIANDLGRVTELSKKHRCLIITNTIKKAVELYTRIKETSPECNVNLLHSMFLKKDRLEKEEQIMKMKRPGIWISTQIVEASLDIDYDFLFTEFSTLDSLFQRMGRCYRKRTYMGKIPNVYVYTRNCSGVGRIYDRELHNLGKDLLYEFDNRFIFGKDKAQSVREAYSKERLENTRYYNEFKKALEMILTGLPTCELSKQDVHKELRDSAKLKVIPVQVFEEHKDLIEQFKMEKDKVKRFEMYISNISPLTVEVPFFKLSELKDKLEYDQELDVFKLYVRYDKELGLIFSEEVKQESVEFI
ncbi:CRISPR-associated helicase/endonuclease Cas3 [Fervidobacterium islandicum]|uniref:CRISPR-associated helicase/endonuclease Cas3 n=1 Tax=Fervidobacterium islandicum TaxID=2423 RepID=A0AAI8GDC9_FERIS|nr:CRISPR-associated helicase/endonuclease Cas3 [Fervidobacterium islandicum]AMW33135.1 CRISPR-associated helicase/endonuclease Cas3 [Fervidobacterium islandicum]